MEKKERNEGRGSQWRNDVIRGLDGTRKEARKT